MQINVKLLFQKINKTSTELYEYYETNVMLRNKGKNHLNYLFFVIFEKYTIQSYDK